MMAAPRANWFLGILLGVPSALLAVETPPSVPGIDAPELARLGPFSVGYRIAHLVQPAQVDLQSPDSSGGFARKDRVLDVDIWYPAQAQPAQHPAKAMVYKASLTSEPPAPPADFSIDGIAVRDAPVASGPFPLVVVSHGYGNVTVAMTWLTENLASKGYVVAAIRHEDPVITDPSKYPVVLQRRPLDIAFVAAALGSTLAKDYAIDSSRVALIGYSMGGYGVLTSAGATLDPAGGLGRMPGGVMQQYLRGAEQADALRVKNLRAVVAMAPAGGGTLAAWGTAGLQDIRAPLLLIAGDHDRTVDYTTGARAFFDSARRTRRYLLTLQNCGHAIGLNPAPATMQSALWNLDWFEDPVWRKSRITGVTTHFITAFLDRYVKGDESRAAYIDVAVADGSAGTWPATAALPYGAYSPGTDGFTVWKGFQRKEAVGLQLLRADAAAN